MTVHLIEDVLTLDLPGGLTDCPATYRADTDWYRGNLDVLSVRLSSFDVGGATFGRTMAVLMIGLPAVQHQERIIADRWAETAERDHAIAAAEDRQALREDA